MSEKIANLKASIEKEMLDPRSPWTLVELMFRLVLVEQAEQALLD